MPGREEHQYSWLQKNREGRKEELKWQSAM